MCIFPDLRILILALVCSMTSPLVLGQGLKTACKNVGGWEIRMGDYSGSCDEQGWMHGAAHASHPALRGWILLAEFKNGLPVGDWVIARSIQGYRLGENYCKMSGVRLDGENKFSWKSMECKSYRHYKMYGTVTMIASDRFRFDGARYRSERFSFEGDGVFQFADMPGFLSKPHSVSIKAEVESVEQKEPPWIEIRAPLLGRMENIIMTKNVDDGRDLPKAIIGSFIYYEFGVFRLYAIENNRSRLNDPPRIKVEYKSGGWQDFVVLNANRFWSYSDSNGYVFETTPTECGVNALASGLSVSDRFSFKNEGDFLTRIYGCVELRLPGKAPVRGWIDGRTKIIKPF